MYKIEDFSEHTNAVERLNQLRLERHEFIKMQLRLRRTTLSQIGRDLGLASGTISTVSKGLGQSRRVQLALAEAIDLPSWKLWPEQFSNSQKEQ